MSKTKQSWVKVESKSQPGKFYFYNKRTNKSSWTPPPDVVPEESKLTAKVVRFSTAPGPASRGQSEHGSSGTKKARPPKLTLQSNNNGNMESATPLATSLAAGAPSPSCSTSNCLEGGVTMGVADSEMEEMDCEERWGDDGEVSMDFDLSEVQQEQMIAEISHTRDTLLPVDSLVSFDLLSGSEANYQDMLYFVLDTNVLISHLHFLVELKDYAIKGVGRPVLIIPWAVMQELDALKTRDSESLASKAKKAIDMLHACFSAGHPRVRGQTMEEVQTEKDVVAISNNDDRILHCCKLYQEKVKGHGGLVVLFSNDIQLCSKAMLNGVKALNRKTLLIELRQVCKSASQAPPTSYTHTKEYASRLAEGQKLMALANFVDDLICQSEAIVREGLAAIVKTEMVEAYDVDLWMKVVIVKPPWSLKDLVHIIDKHWIAVFGLVVGRSLKRTVEGMSSYVAKRTMNIGGHAELEAFHRLAFDLLRAFNAKSDYGGVVPHCLAQLAVLSQKGMETKSGLIPSPHPSTPSTPLPTLQIPQSLLPTSTSPPKLPPTPPTTPGQFPFSNTVPLHIVNLSQTIPSDPLEQLPWLLNLVLEIIKYCHSHILNISQTDRVFAANFLSNVTYLLGGLVSSMNSLLSTQLDVDCLKNVIEAFNNFLRETSPATTSHSSNVVCPLSLTQFYEILRNSEPHCQLMQSAFVQYKHYLDVLNLLN